MGKLAVWSENFTVRFGAVDRSDSMTLSSTFGVFQEAAISHAENMGIGREDMARTGQVWILSRMSALVDRRPRYGETVTVRTWPRGWEKLFAIRDYDIRDARGDAIVRARSCWIIVEIASRRPVRPQAALEGLDMNEGMDATGFVPERLEERACLRKAEELRAAYSDVDYNGHVNNVSYVRWLENSASPADLERARQSRLDINYMSEVLPGESVGIWAGDIESPEGGPPPLRALAFEGKKAGDGKPAFRAELRAWA